MMATEPRRLAKLSTAITTPANGTSSVSKVPSGMLSNARGTSGAFAAGTYTSNYVRTATLNIGPRSDLGTSKSASPNMILDAQTTVFALTVTNAGPNAATTATERHELPSGLVGMLLLSLSGSGGGTLTASVVSATQFNGTLTLPVGASVMVRLLATAGRVGKLVSQATVTVPAD